MSFLKYPKIRRIKDLFIGPSTPGFEELEGMLSNPDDSIVIEEKIDGANCRFYITHDGDLYFGSRNRDITDDVNTSKGGFTRFKDHIRFKLNDLTPEQLKEYGGLIFYGEGCWKHSTPYNFDGMPIFLGYDIRRADVERSNEGWTSYPNNKEVFEKFKLTFVPVLASVKAKGIAIDFLKSLIKKSQYGDVEMEGIMIKNYNTGQFAKLVTEKHQEEAKLVFGSSPKLEEDDTDKLVASLCTNVRIDKIIFKLLDDGKQLSMALMQWLPKLVVEDIYEEGFREVYFSGKTLTIDFRRFRKRIAKRCAAVLGNFIANNLPQNEGLI